MTVSTLPAPPLPRKPWWRLMLKWTWRVALVLVVLGVAAYAVLDYRAARAIHNEITRIRAAGEPLTFGDLGSLLPRVKRDQDAGPYYAAATELAIDDFGIPDPNYNAFYGRQAPAVSPEILAQAHHSLEQNRLALELLDRGSALPGCNADIQLDCGIQVALPHLRKVRGLLDVASLRSRVLAYDGQGDRAVKSIISALGLLRIVERQPVLIDSMVYTWILARVSDDTRFLLDKGHPTDAALQKLDVALRSLCLLQPRQIILAERVYMLEIMRDIITLGSRTNADEPNGPSLPERQIMRSSLGLRLGGRIMTANSLPDYARFINAASGDWPVVINVLQLETNKPASHLASIRRESWLRAIVMAARQVSNYRSSQIAVRIEHFRLAHGGQLPDSLAQLPNSSDLPKDPFTGNDLLYVKIPDGYCIFSAGRGNPEDSNVDREKDPVAWSRRFGIHIRLDDAAASQRRPS